MYRASGSDSDRKPIAGSSWHTAELGMHFIDGLIAVQRAPDGHVWYMPAYARACVRRSHIYDWERLVRALLVLSSASELPDHPPTPSRARTGPHSCSSYGAPHP